MYPNMSYLVKLEYYLTEPEVVLYQPTQSVICITMSTYPVCHVYYCVNLPSLSYVLLCQPTQSVMCITVSTYPICHV